jgi:fatty-acyl-CoA synthase
MITADILGERARLTPEKTALVDVSSGERFTYRELDERAIRCARLLREHLHIAPGDRVGILTNNRVEMLDLFFAAAKGGFILVPLNTRYTPHELETIIADSGMKLLLYESDFAATIDRLPTEDRTIVPLDRSSGAARCYADMLAGVIADGWSGAAVSPEDLLCLLYTSGTTGKPKGVMVPHRMVAWNGYNTAICWQLREDDVSPIFTPLYHAGGLGAFLIPILTIGGTIVLHRAFDAGEVWRTIERERCSVILGVPTIYKMLMEAPEFATTNLSCVRWFISGGAPLPLYLIDAYQRRGVTFKQGYGLTEVGVNCFSMTTAESLRKQGSIGKPLMFTEARLAAQDGSEVSAGETGELWLRGPHVSRGYWNNSEATAEALDEEGWFHTGDLARRDEEGFFYIAGRAKDMFISGGANVYPAEIERELLLHPGIADAAVIGVPNPTWGEVGVAYLVARGHEPNAEDLVAHLTGRLAKYKVPREFIFLSALPRSAYGKVLKPELAADYAARHPQPT